MITEEVVVRFMEHITFTNSCWLFRPIYKKAGYGKFKINQKFYLAHRISYIIHSSEEPGDRFVLHKCDVRNCVNPEHLYLGNQLQNMKDMKDRGRQKSYRVLTEKSEQLIARLHNTGKYHRNYLAILLDCSPQTVAAMIERTKKLH